MYRMHFGWLCRFLGIVLVLSSAACGAPEEVVTTSRQLTDGWSIQAAAEVTGGGAELSAVGFDTSGWFATAVPATPMAALVGNGLYPDLYLGTNLENCRYGAVQGAVVVPDRVRDLRRRRGKGCAPAVSPGSTTRPTSGSTASSLLRTTRWLVRFVFTSSTFRVDSSPAATRSRWRCTRRSRATSRSASLTGTPAHRTRTWASGGRSRSDSPGT